MLASTGSGTFQGDKPSKSMKLQFQPKQPSIPKERCAYGSSFLQICLCIIDRVCLDLAITTYKGNLHNDKVMNVVQVVSSNPLCQVLVTVSNNETAGGTGSKQPERANGRGDLIVLLGRPFRFAQN